MKTYLSRIIFFCGLIAAFNSAFAQSWIQQTNAPNEIWSAIALSADGTRLVATSKGSTSYDSGGIYTSTNSGATWALSGAPSEQWVAVASSANGSNLLAACYPVIATSTNAGSTWSTNDFQYEWDSVASSGDGEKLVAGATGFGYIFNSTNSGSTWITNNLPSAYWDSVVSSADGDKLATIWPVTIYTSTNTGGSWSTNTAPIGGQTLALSADGGMLVLINDNYVSSSTNFGTSWNTSTLPGAAYLTLAAALSADGTTLAADGKIYTTTNGGVNWASNNVPGLNWISVASSADGCKLAAVAYNGGIYTWQSTPTPALSLMPSPTNLTVVWTVPSTNFALEQSPDLISWSDVTDTPAVNFSNLQNQVTLSPTNSNGFYRLATP